MGSKTSPRTQIERYKQNFNRIYTVSATNQPESTKRHRISVGNNTDPTEKDADTPVCGQEARKADGAGRRKGEVGETE